MERQPRPPLLSMADAARLLAGRPLLGRNYVARVARVVAVDGRAVEVFTDGHARDVGAATADMPHVDRAAVGPITYGASDAPSVAPTVRLRMSVTTIVNGHLIGRTAVPRHSRRNKWQRDGKWQGGRSADSAMSLRPPVPLGPGW